MIDFTLKINLNLKLNLLESINISNGNVISPKNIKKVHLEFAKKTEYKKITSAHKLLFIIGDLILSKNQKIEDLLDFDFHKEIRNLKGFFYILEITRNYVRVFSSIFSILPVYYYYDSGIYIISSKVHLISKSLNQDLSISKRFLLEQRLFNYPFFDETIYNDIKLVPCNSYLEFSKNKHRLVKHTRIEDYFPNEPIPWEQSTNQITEYFLNMVKEYLSDEEFHLSFTGGFDGRTLVGCALHFDKKFKTYSFGASDNVDITIPLKQSVKIGVDFTPILLEEEYIEQLFLRDGSELIQITDAYTNFLQVHFFSAAKVVAKHTKYLLNGMFGSELMRAMHISGQVTSKALVDFFMFDSEDKWIKLIRESPCLDFLNKNNFKNEMEELIDDLKVYKTNLDSSLSKNNIFYKFIFEEAFRKFFGTLIMAQFSYLNVRSPYLDFKFTSEFLKTELAGANNHFFTHNPLKRKKGQLFYAKIMEKSCKQLLYLRNDKWYKPIDLIRPWGILNIALGYFGKRIKKKLSPPIVDNLRIVSGVNHNMALYKSLEINENLFNKRHINDLFENSKWLKNRDNFVEILSVIYYLNKYGIGKQK